MSTATASPLDAYRTKPALVRKAIALVEAGAVAPIADSTEYRVTSASGAKYVTDAYRQTCTCVAGQHGRLCYHLAAAIAVAEGHARTA